MRASIAGASAPQAQSDPAATGAEVTEVDRLNRHRAAGAMVESDLQSRVQTTVRQFSAQGIDLGGGWRPPGRTRTPSSGLREQSNRRSRPTSRSRRCRRRSDRDRGRRHRSEYARLRCRSVKGQDVRRHTSARRGSRARRPVTQVEGTRLAAASRRDRRPRRNADRS